MIRLREMVRNMEACYFYLPEEVEKLCRRNSSDDYLDNILAYWRSLDTTRRARLIEEVQTDLAKQGALYGSTWTLQLNVQNNALISDLTEHLDDPHVPLKLTELDLPPEEPRLIICVPNFNVFRIMSDGFIDGRRTK